VLDIVNIRISHIRLLTLFVVSQAVLLVLLSQRQEIALLLFIPSILVAPLLLRFGPSFYKSSVLSLQGTVILVILLAFVSNLSYLMFDSDRVFEHWIRLLGPFLLILLSIKIFRDQESEINIFVFVFAVTLIISVVKTFSISDIIVLQQGVQNQTNWGNAVGAASPFIFLLKNKLLRDVLLLIAVSALIISLKRSGLLAAVALVFAYITPGLASFRFKLRIATSKLRAILASAAVFAGGMVYLMKSEQFAVYLMRAETRILNTSQDGGSGRVDLWASTIDIFLNSSSFELIFGRGFGWYSENYQMLGFGSESLHNDFLEFLIGFGIFGAILYIILIARLFLLMIAFRGSGEYASFAISLVLIFLIYSIFAGVFYYSFFFAPLFVGIAYLEVKNPNRPMTGCTSRTGLNVISG
jgi:O-antigen ligase